MRWSSTATAPSWPAVAATPTTRPGLLSQLASSWTDFTDLRGLGADGALDCVVSLFRAIHLSRLHWCDALPRLAGWCPVPAFARRAPVMVRHGRGLLGLSGVASLAGRVRLPTM